jgi:hypothetical protein
MTEPWFDDDDQLLVELGIAVGATDDMPERFVQAGRAAFAWRGVDVELARLQTDSAADLADAGMRAGQPGHRSLTFVTESMTVELDVQPDALRGQVSPPQAGTVRVHPLDGKGPIRSFDIDDVGWFVIRPVPSGSVQLSLDTAGGTAVTSWFTV